MVNKPDDIRIQRINLKNTSVYTKEIISYIDVLERKIISYKDLVFHDIIYEKEVIQSLYENRFHTKPIFERLKMISDYIADRYETDFNVSVSKKNRQQIYDSLLEMLNFTDVVALYQNFVDYLSNKYDILKGDKIDTCEILYEDIYPIVLIKILLFGTHGFQNIKHVIIDEMQDYNATQYEILNRIFDCNMTILGDIQQVIYKTNDDVIEKLKDMFQDRVKLIKMMKSYRSTLEISEFCKNICNATEMEPFDRHGKEPLIVKCNGYNNMVLGIEKTINKVDPKSYSTVAVICKSKKSAQKFYNSIRNKDDYYLMNDENTEFREGKIITNAFLAKGLEFDMVIIPEVTITNYKTDIDRQILYVACTRALHELYLYYYDEVSEFIQKYPVKIP
ncbi:ATP-binding domain-containing protein [Anaerocolumna sp. MB42-C2]|uniref:ATP-binding domain-containing protein n=1 Tax=Anaerocolumna sp. MB42-C2 TaxID=3070997 RepID=UPI0027E0C3FC|nr:ATP-binding domain-containing protein [Anaerocolumna sp. MB42-C2]WMJ89966.1 ATP-binding domain-containing protein [Anaerocolumna sp. MB42-C2]